MGTNNQVKYDSLPQGFVEDSLPPGFVEDGPAGNSQFSIMPRPVVPQQYSVNPSSTSTQTFNPVPLKEIGTFPALAKVGGSILNTGISGASTLGGPLTAAGGGILGNTIQQLIDNAVGYNTLDVGGSLRTGQTQTQETNPSFDVGSALLQGGMNAVAGKAFESPSISGARSQKILGGVEKSIRTAAPPTRTELNYSQNFARARNYLADQQRTQPITTLREGTEAANQSIRSIDNKVSEFVQKFPGNTVNGETAFKSAEQSIGNMTLTAAEKTKALKFLDELGLKNKNLPIAEADKLRSRLGDESYSHNQMNTAQRASANISNADVTATKAALHSLRNQIYGNLERMGIKDVAELRKDQGSLIAMRDAFERNIVRSEKSQPPISGHGLTTNVRSLARNLGMEFLARRGTPNATFARGMSKLGKLPLAPRDVTAVPPNISGLLNQAPRQMGGPTETTFNISPAQVVQPSRADIPQRLLNQAPRQMGGSTEITFNISPAQVVQPSRADIPQRLLNQTTGQTRFIGENQVGQPQGFVPPRSMYPSTDPIENIVARAGGNFKGVNDRGLVFFDDPSTGSTLMIQAKDLTESAVRNKISSMKARGPYPEWKYSK